MLDSLVYHAARMLIVLLQALPLRTVARLGRMAGLVAYGLDRRHRKVALRNLEQCFGAQKSDAELHAIARENFRRIGENYASAIKMASLTKETLRAHVEFVGTEKLQNFREPGQPNKPRGLVIALGHFGNFEAFTRFGQLDPDFRPIATYRGLRQPALNRLMQSLRSQSGCRFFERRTQLHELKTAMQEPGVVVGFLSDQHAGRSGVRLPFLGRECSTTAAPAVFALRYRCSLFTAICYRVALAQWRVELGEEIPTRHDGKPRPVGDIMTDVNRAFEAAVLRDPANWFWVHDRWKESRINHRLNQS